MAVHGISASLLLKEYIESQGGEVVAVSTLTSSGAGSTMLALRAERLKMLREKFDNDELTQTLREYGIADQPETLTDGEAAAIGRFNSLNTFRDRLAATQLEIQSGQDASIGFEGTEEPQLKSGLAPDEDFPIDDFAEVGAMILTEGLSHFVHGIFVEDKRVRKELLDAYKGVVDAVRASKLPARSRRMDDQINAILVNYHRDDSPIDPKPARFT